MLHYHATRLLVIHAVTDTATAMVKEMQLMDKKSAIKKLELAFRNHDEE
jgi:hypothetical protein